MLFGLALSRLNTADVFHVLIYCGLYWPQSRAIVKTIFIRPFFFLQPLFLLISALVALHRIRLLHDIDCVLPLLKMHNFLIANVASTTCDWFTFNSLCLSIWQSCHMADSESAGTSYHDDLMFHFSLLYLDQTEMWCSPGGVCFHACVDTVCEMGKQVCVCV